MLKQDLRQKQLLKLSPQQIQLMKMIQLPTIAFEEAIKQEIEENPALEKDDYNSNDTYEETEYDDYEDNQQIDTSEINIDEYLSDDETPSYKTQSNNYSDDDEERELPFAQGVSFHEYLVEQLHTFRLTEEHQQIADFIIGNIDDDGYLRREVSAIVDDLAFTQGISTDVETVASLLKNYIQKLDPSGVGSKDLQECLLIQLRDKEQTHYVELAYQILNKHFDAFTKKHYSKIIQKLDIEEEDLKEAILEIEKLNPKPGKSISNNSKSVEQIIPDFEIKIYGDKLELLLNSRNAPDLKVSRDYSDMLDTYKHTTTKSKEQKDAVMFVKQKLDSAKWFIDAIKQRQQTLYITMRAIMEYQEDYFLSGDNELLRPMILKDIADITSYDISTISRVANSKYVQTPYGTMLIKTLFSESLTNNDGEEVSTREIKTILKEVVDNEDPKVPLTDDKLMDIMKKKGYNIARRTIAKYRDQLNIPVARLRKQL